MLIAARTILVQCWKRDNLLTESDWKPKLGNMQGWQNLQYCTVYIQNRSWAEFKQDWLPSQQHNIGKLRFLKCVFKGEIFDIKEITKNQYLYIQYTLI